jgi:ribose transport system substrate-binding protein
MRLATGVVLAMALWADQVMLPAEVIDKSNYKALLVPLEQRACPDWAALVQ